MNSAGLLQDDRLVLARSLKIDALAVLDDGGEVLAALQHPEVGQPPGLEHAEVVRQPDGEALSRVAATIAFMGVKPQ